MAPLIKIAAEVQHVTMLVVLAFAVLAGLLRRSRLACLLLCIRALVVGPVAACHQHIVPIAIRIVIVVVHRRLCGRGPGWHGVSLGRYVESGGDVGWSRRRLVVRSIVVGVRKGDGLGG